MRTWRGACLGEWDRFEHLPFRMMVVLPGCFFLSWLSCVEGVVVRVVSVVGDEAVKLLQIWPFAAPSFFFFPSRPPSLFWQPLKLKMHFLLLPKNVPTSLTLQPTPHSRKEWTRSKMSGPCHCRPRPPPRNYQPNGPPSCT